MHKSLKIQRIFISNIKLTFSKLISQTNLHTLSSSRNALDYSFNLKSSQTLFHQTQVEQVEQKNNHFTGCLRGILVFCQKKNVNNEIPKTKQDKMLVKNGLVLFGPNLKLGAELILLYALRKLHVSCKIWDIQQKFDKICFSIEEAFLFLSSQIENNYLIRFGGEREITNKISEASNIFSQNLAKPKSDNLQNKFEKKDDKKDKDKKENRKLAWPPKLPLIKNSFIRARVFTHKSVSRFKTKLSKADWLKSHNKRLEFLGDTVLNHTVTMMIYKKFPNMDEGDLTKLRIELINNKRLKEWSFLYNFQNKLREVLYFSTKGSISQAEFQLRKQKIYADVFEAYIGGLMEEDSSNNLPLITEWLEALSAPVIADCLKPTVFSCDEDIDRNAKGKLYSIIGFPALNLHYVAVKIPSPLNPIAEVECRIKGEKVLGRGIGKNIKLANLRAAQSVLDNRDLVEKFSKVRFKYFKKVKQRRSKCS